MLVLPTRDSSGNLLLSVYSFDPREVDAVLFVLKKYAIEFFFDQITPDRSGRSGIKYIIPSSEVGRLGERLGGAFDDNGSFVPSENADGESGKHFACRQITYNGTGSGCVDVIAEDENDARLKCALIANDRNWFGGVPSPGACNI
jgi:hypothetical protein